MEWLDVQRYLDGRFDRLEKRLDGYDERIRGLEATAAEGRGERRGLRGFWANLRDWGAVTIAAVLAGWTMARGH